MTPILAYRTNQVNAGLPQTVLGALPQAGGGP